MRVAGSGSVEMINVQESWRQEAMDGSLEETPDGWLLHLVGRHFVLAPNVAATERTLRLSGESLSYEMSMATDRVPELVFHVTADLRRAAS